VTFDSRKRFQPLVLLFALGLGGCMTVRGELPSVLTNPGKPPEHCLDLMLESFARDDIDITHQDVANLSTTTTVVTIEATRNNVVPSPAIARDIAVECKFEHDILIDFHWTKPPFH
jgi:hypothetical protein